MPGFLDPELLRQAVLRLSASAAKSTVMDYLVFKRALQNTWAGLSAGAPRPQAVTTGTASAPFRTAIHELAACTNQTLAWTGPPFFSPFGAERDKGAGYKSGRYPSNGPSDTVGGWQSRGATPLVLVPNTSPKQFTFATRSPQELSEFFLTTDGVNAADLRPVLLDAALWWFRFEDVETLFGGQPTASQLVDAFAKAVELHPPEESGIFAPWRVPFNFPPLVFTSNAAAPQSYLPPVPVQQQGVVAASTPTAVAPKANATTAAAAPLVQPIEERVAAVVNYIKARGFIFEPWQVAAFITAARTKPFIILAGISGTGKTKLPRLVAEATGAHFENIPVRPDWTDSSELLGYVRLNHDFVPGRLLSIAKEASANPSEQYFVLLDEMNIARIEYYMAEVLSHIEEKSRSELGIRSQPLLSACPDDGWSNVCLPGNLCIVGSVNMDESTQGFSKKVLDRSFVIEFSDVDLSVMARMAQNLPAVAKWSAKDWEQRFLTLSEYPSVAEPEVTEAIDALVSINEALDSAQLQVGYRVRDEVVLFCANARDCLGSFTTSAQGTVDPLDLAITMKVLPRIQGSNAVVGTALNLLKSWSHPPSGSGKRSFPHSGERIALMQARLDQSGFTSYWL